MRFKKKRAIKKVARMALSATETKKRTGLYVGRENRCSVLAMFEMTRHPEGDGEVEDGHTCLEFKGEFQAQTTDWGRGKIINI